MSTRPASWAIYARISRDREGSNLAVERQEEDCRKLAESLGLKGEPDVYIDNDVSATSRKPRPEGTGQSWSDTPTGSIDGGSNSKASSTSSTSGTSRSTR